MRKLLFLALLVIPLFTYAQQSINGKVISSDTKEPLAFVNITTNGSKYGTTTDIDGRFKINTNIKVTSLTFSFIGFKKQTIQISPETKYPLTVELEEDVEFLNDIVLTPGVNPAHRIIKKTVKNRDINNPEKLKSFQYESYSKFIITGNTDSVPDIEEPLTAADSSNKEMKKFFNSQHLFIMESVTERKFRKPDRSFERVLASRVSGLKDPMFTLLATQMQSFTFYNDFIEVLGRIYVNPITPGSTRKYIFDLRDTTYSGTDTVYTIYYEPNPGSNFDGLKGLLYINTSTFAIQNVTAEPAESIGFGIKIQQQYELIEESWFPTQLNYDFRFDQIAVNNAKVLGIGRTYLSEIKIEPELSRREFSSIDLKIENDAGEKPEEFWNQYRKDTLDSKEKETYRVIDSVGEAINLDEKLNWFMALRTGKIGWKAIDFDLTKIFGYNQHEGFRLGLGLNTNYKFSEWFEFGGYIAYGFKDKVFKHNTYGEALLDRNTELKIGLSYTSDVMESGGINFMLEPQRGFLSTDLRDFNIENYDEVRSLDAYVGWKPIPQLETRVFARRMHRERLDPYLFNDPENTDITTPTNSFNFGETGIAFRYSPNDRYMETKYGRILLSSDYPIITGQITKGIDGFVDGEFDYTKIDLKIDYSFTTVDFGVTSFTLGGGFVDGNIPYTNLFIGQANFNAGDNLFDRITIGAKNAFETMRMGEFLSDRYVSLVFRHNFKSLLFRTEKFRPEIELVSRATFGQMGDINNHLLVDFNTPKKGFYESGLELNNLWKNTGIGFYYRYGPYSLEDFEDNLSIKITTGLYF